MDDIARHHAVSRFLFREARLLDERRFDEWLRLWTSDAVYLLPTTWSDDTVGQRSAGADDVHHLRLDRAMLNLRIAKLTSGSAWAEVPASRTVRSVSNVEVIDEHGVADASDVAEVAASSRVRVESTVVVHRVRYTDDGEVHAARRDDLMVHDGGRWLLARRRVRLAHRVLLARDLEFFL